MRVVTGEVVSRRSIPAYSAYAEAARLPLQYTPEQRAALQQKMNLTVQAVRLGFATAQKVADFRFSNWVAVAGDIMANFVTLGLWGTTGGFSTPAEAKQAVINALTTLQRTFDLKVVAAMPRVLDGTLEPDRWFKMAKAIADGILPILNNLREDSTSAALRAQMQALGPALAKIGEAAGAIAENLSTGVQNTFRFLPVIVAFVGAVAVYALIKEVTAPVRVLTGTARRALESSTGGSSRGSRMKEITDPVRRMVQDYKKLASDYRRSRG